MLKNQLVHLQSESLSIPELQRSRLRWCGSRASGKHILHISQTPGILSIINEDTQLDMVNLILKCNDLAILDHPSSLKSTSSFWKGNFSNEVPFPINYFDAIMIEDTLAEILPVHKDKLQRLVKPNGKIIVSEKLSQAMCLKDEWRTLLSNNEMIDQRVDEHYVNVVLRNIANVPEHPEPMAENLLKEMQKVNDRKNKKYTKALHEKLEERKTEERTRLQDKNKLMNNIPFIRKKHEAIINQLELSSEEKRELLPHIKEVIIQAKKCSLKHQLRHFQDTGKITIVFGKSHFHRKNSLVFSHQLAETLHLKGKNILYVHKDVQLSFAPIFRKGSQFMQVSTTDFFEHLHVFEAPEMYVNVQDFQLAKRIGRLQWKKWGIYYFPEEIVDQEVHSFFISSLHPQSFRMRMNSYLISNKHKLEQSLEKTLPGEEKRIVVGYVGNLEQVDYRAIKEMLVSNQKVVVELIGYNQPDVNPINTKRLMVKEYTTEEELRKRVEKWTFGILPFGQKELLISHKRMRNLGKPLLVMNDWSASIQEQKVCSLDHEETLSQLIEEAISILEGEGR